MFFGIIVMVGWFFNIPILTSILPFWVTMKFTTALSFLLSGLILYFVIQYRQGKTEIANIALPISALIILLLMTTLLVSIFVGVRTGIEDLFVQEVEGAVKTTTPGRPSAGTMVAFILISSLALLTLFNLSNIKKWIFWLGIIIGLIGGVGVLGYVIGIPLLYYTVKGGSTAMAFHTAILFTLLGIGLFLLGKEEPPGPTEATQKEGRIPMTLNARLIIIFLVMAIIPVLFVGGLTLSNAEKTFNQIEETIDKEQRSELLEQVSGLKSITIVIGILALILVSIVAISTARSISYPIVKLTRAINEISRGNLNSQIDPELRQSKDEIGGLATAFNKMTEGLKDKSTEAQKELTMRKKAEEKLKNRVEELEKFHKLTIGRELKMIELKKKIKELERKK